MGRPHLAQSDLPRDLPLVRDNDPRQTKPPHPHPQSHQTIGVEKTEPGGGRLGGQVLRVRPAIELRRYAVWARGVGVCGGGDGAVEFGADLWVLQSGYGD